MKALLCLAIGLILLNVLYGFAENKPKLRYVPVGCISRLTISDWGKCQVTGDTFDCPAAHVKFMAGCTSPKDDGKRETKQPVQFPTAVLTDSEEK